MHYQRVQSYFGNQGRGSIAFVAPAVSAMLAAARSTNTLDSLAKSATFTDKCRSYAENNGLVDVLNGRYQFPIRGGMQGVRYTKLTRLATHDEVDGCNAIVNDLFTHQLVGYSAAVISKLAKVVGELHDNVASHASGAGFSCAQVYQDNEGRRIEFAIADAGCGMLKNVSREYSQIADDRDAIKWCLQKGNTTARQPDNWAQRLPDDSICSPYPDDVDTIRSDDHHVGEGLWQLCELVRGSSGKFVVLSGKGEYLVDAEKEFVRESCVAWPGVVVEFEITIPIDTDQAQRQSDHLEAIARRIGI